MHTNEIRDTDKGAPVWNKDSLLHQGDKSKRKGGVSHTWESVGFICPEESPGQDILQRPVRASERDTP